ncbi:MAG: hypothetical protein ACI837_002643 [Crocinitomicaceae bacterium]|jgi:hypothetical protein
MKHIVLFWVILLTSTSLLASNQISVGEKFVVVANSKSKKITVHDKATLEIVHTIFIENGRLYEVALSSDESTIWYRSGATMYCISTSTWEPNIEFEGFGVYRFELNNQNKQLIHYENSGESTIVDIFDLNSAVMSDHMEIPFSGFIESIFYNDSTDQLIILTPKFDLKSELPLSEEEAIIFPETKEEVELSMRHDGKGSRLVVFDKMDNIIHDDTIYYSSNFSTDLDMIGDRLFLITQIGNCEILEDYSLRTTSFIATNVQDYTIHETSIYGSNSFNFFQYNSTDDSYTEFWDDDMNKIIVEANAVEMDETHCFVVYDNILYRFKQDNMREVDWEVSVE